MSRSRPEVTAGSARFALTLASLLTAMFMAQFDFFVVNVAAPTIETKLHASQGALQLIVAAYAFAFAAGMITGGRLGDLFGHRMLFVGGMIGFTLASGLCGIAATPAELIAARVAQGVGAAAMIPQVLAVINTAFDDEDRPRALGWYGAAAGLGAIAGQVLGGLLLKADLLGLGWRSVFLVNLPVGALALPVARRVLPSTRSRHRPSLDPVGAVGVATAIGLVLVPLAFGRTSGWATWTWLCIACSLIAGTLTIWWERALGMRGGAPVLVLSLFRDKAFLAGLAAGAAFLAYFASFMFTLTLLLQAGFGLDALQAGLVFVPMGVTFVVASLTGRRLVDRYGTRALVLAGLSTAASLASIIAVLGDRSIAVGWIIPGLAFGSAANGIVLPSLVGVTLAKIEAHHAGAAAGTMAASQQFAGALGVAGVGGVFFAALGNATGRRAYERAMQEATAVNIALVGLMIVGFLLLARINR